MSKRFFLFPFFIALYEMVTYLANDMYLPALPDIKIDLATTNALSQQSLSAWFLGSAIPQGFVGPLSEKYGRRPVFFFGAAVFILSCFFAAKTTNIYIFLFLRALQGATIPCMIIPGYSLIHEFLPRIQAIKVTAIMGSIIVIAPAFGPLLGSIFTLYYSWRYMFLTLSFFALFTVVCLFFTMPESKKLSRKEPICWVKVIYSYIEFFKNKSCLIYTLYYGLTLSQQILWIVVGPFFVIEFMGLTKQHFALTQAFVFGIYILTTFIVRTAVDRLSISKIIQFGISFCLLGSIYIIIFSFIDDKNLLHINIGLAISSFGAGFVLAPSARQAIEKSTLPMGIKIGAQSIATSILCTIISYVAIYLNINSMLMLGVTSFFISIIIFLIKTHRVIARKIDDI